jgi:hypothetical protein
VRKLDIFTESERKKVHQNEESKSTKCWRLVVTVQLLGVIEHYLEPLSTEKEIHF